MPIEGFDYKAFAISLSQQALELLNQSGMQAVPSSLTDEDKKGIYETVQKFCYMAGEALSNDSQLNFNADQACLVTQFIGEWAFHKSVDLIKNNIPPQNRESILQIIAANIFNTAKLAIIKKMPQDALINLIEEKVNQVYKDELTKLLNKGVLSKEQYEVAINSSNLNDFVKKVEDESNIKRMQQASPDNVSALDKKTIKLAALAIILKKLPQEKVNQILGVLEQADVNHVVNYMQMSGLEEKIDKTVILKTLDEIKKMLPVSDNLNVSKLLKRHHKNIKTASEKLLNKVASKERDSVKDFILNAKYNAAGTYTPHVIKSLVYSIEKQLDK